MRCRKSKLAAAIALSFPLFLAAQTELPAGPGREAVKKVCSDCHEIETVISSRRTKAGWQQITDDMVSRGAEGTDEEMAAVVQYLTTWFGKVNVNTASVADLQKLLDLSEKQARAIAAYRDHNGKIKNFDELEKVPGVDPEKLRMKRSLIAFSQ
jgi:competence ComEA-like helix-hairpin-helix protein